MKRSAAASLTILAGVILVVASSASVLLGASAFTIYGLVVQAGIYVGGLLIAVGVYVHLQSMSTAPGVPVNTLCPQCGKSNLQTNKFCDKCGTRLSTERF